MTLIEKFYEDLRKKRIFLPRKQEQDKNKRKKLGLWLSKTIEEMIEEEGAFFSSYEIPLADITVREKHDYDFFELTYRRNPFFREADKTKRISLAQLAQKSFSRDTTIRPEFTRGSTIKYLDIQEATKYLKNIVTITLSPKGIYIATLKEPFKTFLKDKMHYYIGRNLK